MFSYSSHETVLPSLVFTKAELVYAMSILMADIPPNDNETRIEMVELRHYLTLIKDRVSLASSDGTLKRAMTASPQNIGDNTPPILKAAPMPSMDELRRQFPSLTDEEIEEAITKAAKERKEEEEKRRATETSNAIPPPPSFIAKPIAEVKPSIPQPPLTKKQIADKENSRKFATLLGAK